MKCHKRDDTSGKSLQVRDADHISKITSINDGTATYDLCNILENFSGGKAARNLA